MSVLFVKEAVFIRILGLPAQRVKVRVALPKEDTNKNALIVGVVVIKQTGIYLVVFVEVRG